MQKLTILILTTLFLSTVLSAEDEPIILDRDILYWNPSGPDILIPDTYFSPELFRYDEDAFRSSLFFPLDVRKDGPADEGEQIIRDEELVLVWSPPALFRVEEVLRPHSMTFYGSYPYGSGLVLEGSGGIFFYKGTANYAMRDDYSHWISGEAGINSDRQYLSTQIAWRSLNESSLLSLINWNFTSGSSQKNNLSLGAGFQSIFPLDYLKTPEEDSVNEDVHQWKATVGLGGSIRFLNFDIESNLNSEYRKSPDDSYGRISPELLFSKHFSAGQGDWTLEAGLIADINGGGRKDRFFPQLRIDYIEYGHWSYYFESQSSFLEDPVVHRFLTEELYTNPETDFYRFHTLETGLYITEDSFQMRAGGGYRFGFFPELQQGELGGSSRSLYFIDSSIGWNYRTGKVTELNSYADYQDKGSFRFFIENRWQWRKTEGKRAYAFVLRAGNRELLRGYRYFFDDSSELITGSGLEMDFVKPLQGAVYIDYLPVDRSFEGRIEIRWDY